MKTLVTAGCSYTKYNYKTWADYLSVGYDKFQNLGMPGSCPKYAYLKILEYIDIYKSNLESTDIVIQWSSLKRHFLLDVNYPKGQIDNNTDFNDEFIENYFSIEEKAIDLINYIEHLCLLSEKYKFNLYMFFMFEPWIENFAGEPTSSHPIFDYQIDKYKSSKVFSKLKNIYSNDNWITPSLEKYSLKNELRGPEHKTKEGNIDTHPTTEQHRLYCDKVIKNKLNVHR